MTDPTDPTDPTGLPPTAGDDNLMDRFDRAGTRRFSARQGVIAVLLCGVVLALAAGPSIRRQGREEVSSLGRTAVLAVGDPADAVSKLVPLHAGASDMTAFLHPSLDLTGYGGFSYSLAASTGIPPVTQDQFSASAIGASAPARRRLSRVLVTGDSMSEPLDQYVAQTLDPDGVKVIEDPHIGTGISSTLLVNWESLARFQVAHDRPNAVVIFIGANDGYAMPGPGGVTVACCSAAWAAIYANRVRQMMNTYRQAGIAHVYWMTLPATRAADRARIAKVVNAAITVAAQPWADQVTVLNTVPIFTPGDRYRDAMAINGQRTIVRESDGIHLNNAGSQLLATDVVTDIRQNFRLP